MKKTSQQIFNFKRISSFKSSLAIVGLVVMAGCNGGGASNTEVAGLESDLMTGQFIDGPVRGMKYECSSGRFGVTNSQGQYTCKKNDTVSFKIDNVTLGTADAEAILTPVSLSPENTEVAVNIAQLLQTLDDDGDLSSFVIDDEKAALLDASLDVTSASFDADAGTMLSAPLVDEGAAIAHLNESITTLTTMEPISLTAAPAMEPIAALPETKSLTLATPIIEATPEVGIAAGASQYKKSVNIPVYDSGDSSHVLITPSNGNWSASVLNDPNKHHFYIKPGNYTTKINLTRDGTSSNRRTLSLYNGNNTHPASLPDNEQANLTANILADYWTFDRLSDLDKNSTLTLISGSYNIISRSYYRNYYRGVEIKNSGTTMRDNVIQQCYFDHMTHKGRVADQVAVMLYVENKAGTRTLNTRIVDNDIKNANDGIMLMRVSSASYGDQGVDGTIIDGNRIWIDGQIYTNCDYSTNGYNANGACKIGEEALDFKVGSANPANPVIVTNNIMWGYRQTDSTAGGPSYIGKGAVLSSHYGVSNVKFNSNIVFDSESGLNVIGSDNWELKNNIVYDIGAVNPTNESENRSWYFSTGSNRNFTNNTIVKNHLNSSGRGFSLGINDVAKNDTYKNNLFIDAHNTSSGSGHTVENNFFYGSKENFSDDKNSTFKSSTTEAKMGDYAFKYNRYTATPKTKTLKGIISTEASPHFGVAGSLIK